MNNTKQIFSESQVTAYLQFHYAPGFLQNNQDYYYNGIKDAYLSIPFEKEEYHQEELLRIFSTPGTEHSPETELARFILFTNTPKR